MNTSKAISNDEDILDSRDIEERITELESIRDDWQIDNNLPDYKYPEFNTEYTDKQADKWNEWDESEEGIELKLLVSLRDDLEGYCDDWKYGVALIRDSYFQEYATELCKDIGDLPKELPWYIESHIDWEGIADEIKVDYIEADFDGVKYWVR